MQQNIERSVFVGVVDRLSAIVARLRFAAAVWLPSLLVWLRRGAYAPDLRTHAYL